MVYCIHGEGRERQPIKGDVNMINRYLVNMKNGDIQFVKVWLDGGEQYITIIAEYAKHTQTHLDFAAEALDRMENEYPEWADVLEWEQIHEEDLYD